MVDKNKGRVEAAQDLGPSNLSRRFQAAPEPEPVKPKLDKPVAEVAAQPIAKNDPICQPKAAKKPGRPVAPKPWEAEGISRQAWYKRGNRKS